MDSSIKKKDNKMVNISVIGLGFVGITTAIGFAEFGHEIIGVDKDKNKVDLLNKGISPLPLSLPLPGLDKLLNQNEVFATLDIKKAVLNSEISFICVQTPTIKGRLDLNPLKVACRQIGEALREKDHHLVVIRSTVFPGSYEILKGIIEKASKKKCGREFDMALNPEFFREKTAVQDFFNPSFIVVGAENKKIGKKVLECYDGIEAKKFIVKPEIAQMIKYLCNSWHACKIVFTNEIGRICEKIGIDGDKLMGLFCEDTKLNISPYYHKIGNAFSGSCLPKDLKVLQTKAKELKVKCPLIDSISKSNEIQKRGDKK